MSTATKYLHKEDNQLQQLRPRTLTFLLKDQDILPGFKKKGFWKNYLPGIGGKVEKGETIQ